ncbi:hypothetical protein BKA69DRAFT_172311 [Paraphysoderma sedebokerense]|nr:hypothetical protein BKA69DRAFT_172311 [Paraphysoderma sedebokerense]
MASYVSIVVVCNHIYSFTVGRESSSGRNLLESRFLLSRIHRQQKMHSSLDIEALENILSSLKSLPSANACLQSYPEIGSTLHQHLYRRNLDFDSSVNKKLLECALEFAKAHSADEPQSTLSSNSKSKKWFLNNLRSCFIPHQYRDQSMEQMVNVLGFSSFQFYKEILKESIIVILASIENLIEKGIAVPVGGLESNVPNHNHV